MQLVHIVRLFVVAASRTICIASSTAASSRKMPPLRTVAAIDSLEGFEQKLPCYLNDQEQLSIFLDYDGTLAPMAINPNDTVMAPELKNMLQCLSRHPKIYMCVISGRGLQNVKEKVGIENITYAGNHGLEIEYADGARFDFVLPKGISEKYKQLVEELTQKAAKNNAWVEDKRVSLSYHYRQTPPEFADAQSKLAREIITAHGFSANQAHWAIEGKPPVLWNKGEASLKILNTKFGENWPICTKVIFAGDDTTDEDAMKSLQGVAKTFRISDNPDIQTYADFRLPDQCVMADLIKWIAKTYTL